MKIAVIGGGSWGTALARLLSRKGHDIVLWVHEKEVLESIRSARENKIYLPGVTLPETLRASTNMEEVLIGAKWVLFVVPSHVSREVLTRMSPYLTPEIPIISATKGIEQKSLLLISEVIQEVTQRKNTDRIAVLSGPSFAKELVLEHPTAVSLAASDARLAARVQTAFSTNFFKLFHSPDLIGVQLGGALKNVIALAAGGSDGLGFGYNTKAVLMTRGLSEIALLGVAMGADSTTFYGLSGIGDLFLTCSGGHSRNRSVGQQIGNGVSLPEIQKKMKMVAEGIYTTESAFALSKKHQIEMPIVREIYHVLFKEKSPREAVNDLMDMARGEEFP
ncbi:MAG: NAD(P)H-dependent glycerol-3-phosphate dehydrogenase [Nitrospira sp.]|nr:NAD(P)-dependent glycerol-3-phosphate dehydrogenase [Candidatus Manganitrophaceae bacterium]HIL34573.1 NAD(P)-dependent glycerol-3-phosphate dehydrogenase [Candidatus Manganitrophaceae bacterium]